MDYNETGELHINYRSYPHGTHMDRMHFHNSYEMYVMLEGRKNYYLNGKEILLEAPAVILISPTILHRASSPDDLPQRRMLINFSLGIMNRFDDVRDQTVLGKTIRRWLSGQIGNSARSWFRISAGCATERECLKMCG